jgi:hypothetical protein
MLLLMIPNQKKTKKLIYMIKNLKILKLPNVKLMIPNPKKLMIPNQKKLMISNQKKQKLMIPNVEREFIFKCLSV